MGGLEGEALRSMIFLLLLFASFAGKKQQQKNYSRGPAAPAAPAGELAMQYHQYCVKKVLRCFASPFVILSEAKNLSFEVERDPSLRLRMTDSSAAEECKET